MRSALRTTGSRAFHFKVEGRRSQDGTSKSQVRCCFLLFSFFSPHSKYLVNYVRKTWHCCYAIPWVYYWTCSLAWTTRKLFFTTWWLQKNLLIKTLSVHMIVLGVIDFKQNDFLQYEICGNCVTEGLNTLKATFCKPIFVSLQNLMCFWVDSGLSLKLFL